ncbi:MAG: hypothetical protein QOI41_6474 [Myxococcales bacterium]|nr:hypothetical protein [Myxococcales bacterium]
MSEAVRAPKTTKHLDELQRLVREKAGAPPIATLIGFDAVEMDLARSVFEMDAGSRHANPMGTLHGGVICDLSDAAMGTAMATTLEDDESFTTLDLTVKFFKPIWNARLRATAHVVKRTRTLGLVECEVEDDKGSLVAKVFSTCMVLRGQEAKGR